MKRSPELCVCRGGAAVHRASTTHAFCWKAQGRMMTTCMTAMAPGCPGTSSTKSRCPQWPACSCPWCQHRGIKHLISRRSPPSFLLVLNHPRVHVTTDESRSTQVTQMLSLPASSPGDSAGGEGGVRRETVHTRPGCPEPPETTAGWQGAPPPTSCLGLVFSPGPPWSLGML